RTTSAVSGTRARTANPSVFPHTAVTGASTSSSTRMSGVPMSPAWRMWSTSWNRSKTAGRSWPWVSLIRPMRMRGRSIRFAAPPHRPQRCVHREVCEDAANHEVHEVLNAPGLVIEARRRRQDQRAGAGQAEHVLQVDRRVRRLARYEHERAAFLQRHIRGSLNERPRGPLGNAGEGTRGAGADDHAGRGRGSRRRGSAAVLVVVEDDVVPGTGPRP